MCRYIGRFENWEPVPKAKAVEEHFNFGSAGVRELEYFPEIIPKCFDISEEWVVKLLSMKIIFIEAQGSVTSVVIIKCTKSEFHLI